MKEADFVPPIAYVGVFQNKELGLLLPIRGMIVIKEDDHVLTLMDSAQNQYLAHKNDLFGEKSVFVPMISPHALTKIKNAPDAGTSEAD